MMGLHKTLFGGMRQSKDALRPEADAVVTFDSVGIRCIKPNCKQESIAWEKLDAVLIETTEQGPLVPDVFWLLLTKDMTSGCVVPQGATGEVELAEKLQKRLAGFDYEMLIKAMSSTSNQRFLIWERKES